MEDQKVYVNTCINKVCVYVCVYIHVYLFVLLGQHMCSFMAAVYVSRVPSPEGSPRARL